MVCRRMLCLPRLLLVTLTGCGVFTVRAEDVVLKQSLYDTQCASIEVTLVPTGDYEARGLWQDAEIRVRSPDRNWVLEAGGDCLRRVSSTPRSVACHQAVRSNRPTFEGRGADGLSARAPRKGSQRAR